MSQREGQRGPTYLCKQSKGQLLSRLRPYGTVVHRCGQWG